MKKSEMIIVCLVILVIGIFIGRGIFDRKVFVSLDDLKNQELNLVGAVWYVPGKTGFETVRSWNSEDGKKVFNLLLNSERPEYSAFNKRYKIILFFYDSKSKTPTVFETWFDLFGKKFICEGLISSELFEFLQESAPEVLELQYLFDLKKD